MKPSFQYCKIDWVRVKPQISKTVFFFVFFNILFFSVRFYNAGKKDPPNKILLNVFVCILITMYHV